MRTMVRMGVSLLVTLAVGLTLQAGQPPALGLFEQSTDVGVVNHRGGVRVDASAGSYELSGSGVNMWGEADAFHFVSRRVSGDLVLTSDVALLGEGGDPHRKAGLMIRASLQPDAAYADAVVHGDGLISLQYRERAGGPTREIQSPIRAPATLRLMRDGDVFSLEVRRSGGPFQPVGAAVLTLPPDAYAGLVVCAHNADRIERARFTGVTAEAKAVPADAKRVTESTLEIVDVETGERQIVYRARAHFEAPNVSRDGSTLLFNQGGLLYTIPAAGGQPTRMDTGTVNGCNNDHGYSPDGRLVALSCGPRGESRVHVVAASGGQPTLLTELTPSYWHGWSPDGQLLAYVARRNDDYDIYTVPVTGGAERRLTTERGLDDGPDYTADGQWIYFNSERSGIMRLWRMKADGSQQEQVTSDEAYADWFPHPSPDSRHLVWLSYDASVTGHPANKDVVLRIRPLAGGQTRILARLFGGQGTINVPSWFPDSRRLAFVSYRLVL
jgi:TolB protein